MSRLLITFLIPLITLGGLPAMAWGTNCCHLKLDSPAVSAETASVTHCSLCLIDTSEPSSPASDDSGDSEDAPAKDSGCGENAVCCQQVTTHLPDISSFTLSVDSSRSRLAMASLLPLSDMDPPTEVPKLS